jgi:molybdopterin-guanine dinucleotide biosynthesis protein A
MPEIRCALVKSLLAESAGAGAVVPVVRGYDEPLLAVYHRRCVGPAEALLRRGVRPVRALYDLVTVRRIPESQLRESDPTLVSFTNLNSDDALSTWLPTARPSGGSKLPSFMGAAEEAPL